MSAKDVFAAIEKNIKADPGIVARFNGVYQFNVGDEKWTVDLKNAPGSVKEGPAEKADCTLTLKPEDFLAMATGKLNGQQAFMQGKLKVCRQLRSVSLLLFHASDWRQHVLRYEVGPALPTKGGRAGIACRS
jgi:putative sterol carrier protein